MIISSKILHAARAFQASAKDKRHYIRGIHIKDGSVESTNGKSLVIMKSEHKNFTFEEDEMIVDIQNPIPARAVKTELIPDNNNVILKHFDESDKIIAVSFGIKRSGEFPNLNRCIPTKSSGLPTLPIEVWGLFSKAFKSGDMQMKIASEKEGNLFVGDADINKRFGDPVVVIMPATRNRIC